MASKKTIVKEHNGIKYEVLYPGFKGFFYRIFKRKKYKYKLLREYSCPTRIKGFEYEDSFLKITRDGILTIKNNYCTDFSSGPTIDTKSFQRGALVHDAFYQLCRLGVIGQEFIPKCDDELKRICIEDGMIKVRAGYVRFFVVLGRKHARPPKGK